MLSNGVPSPYMKSLIGGQELLLVVCLLFGLIIALPTSCENTLEWHWVRTSHRWTLGFSDSTNSHITRKIYEHSISFQINTTGRYESRSEPPLGVCPISMYECTVQIYFNASTFYWLTNPHGDLLYCSCLILFLPPALFISVSHLPPSLSLPLSLPLSLCRFFSLLCRVPKLNRSLWE